MHCEDVHPDELVRNLPLSRRQMIEIARALGRSPKLLILDEATSALTAADVERIYAILDRFARKGLAIVYISHRMREITAFADDCSVFRNGRHVESFSKGQQERRRDRQADDRPRLQRRLSRQAAHAPAAAPVLEVENLTWGEPPRRHRPHVGKGEIVGLGGLDGQGQRELLLALFGVLRGVDAEIKIDGRTEADQQPARRQAPSVGMALIPEDRKTEGLVLPLSVRDNISLRRTRPVRPRRLHQTRAESAPSRTRSGRFRSSRGADVPVGTLSGGNQQKVVIAKWLLTEARLILLNDPTRGIDVGTKQEIYALLRNWPIRARASSSTAPTMPN